MAKNFLDLSGLSNFLDNLKELFSQSGHKHTVNDLTDYAVDSSLSATSTNPIQNKTVNQALLAFSTDMDNVESNINALSDQLTDHENNANLHVSTTEQTHWDAAYTHSQSTHVSVADSVTSTSTTTAATSKNVKQAYDLANTANTAVGTLNDEFDDHVADTTAHMTSTQKSQLSTAYNHSQETHARTDATKVAKSNTNGNILINGTETVVYTHPSGTNPHGTTKTDIGLGNVDNTSDANKPVSTAQKAAIDAVQSNVNTLSDEFNDHVDNADIHFTAEERTKLSGIATGANKYTHPNSGVTAGTYKSVTVNAAGHVTGGTNPTTLAGYGITDAEVKGTVNTHNTATDAHSDIRLLISNLTTQVNNFLDVDDTTKDELSEVIALIEANADSIESITFGKVNVSDIINNLTTNVSDKPLSASQGVVLRGLIDALQSELDTHENNSDIHFSATERTKLSGIATGAEVNQNAFSNIVVGSTTIAADSKTDSLTLAGSNVTISADATNDKVTFSVANGTTSAKGVVQLTNSTSSTSTTTAATPNSVKSAYDLANTAKTNAATAQTAAETAQETADSKVGSVALASGTNNGTLKLTVDGTTTDNIAVKGLGSAAYTESSAYATLGHTHNYAGSSSAGGAATSANKLNTNAGSATQPVYFADGVPKPTTYALNKTVPSDAVFTDTVYTHPSYTARTGVPKANQTPAFGGTFTVSQPVSDATGHITAVNSRTITIPNAVATTSAVGLMSTSDKTKLNGIATGAEVNQNAFSNVSVNGTTVAADAKTDTLTLAGSNVTLTPDATNDKVTIGITKDNVVSALGYEPGQTNAIVIENITIPVSGFVAQDDGTYLYTMTSDLVVDDTLVDVYFSKDCQKAGMKAGIMVTSEVGKIHFHATKLPTISLVVETLRIINPSQDDSYNEAYDTELEELQNPTFEDYSSTAYSEEFDISVGKIVSKGLFSKILEGIKGSLINLNTRLTSCNNDLKNIVDKIYPIGSIYTSIQDINPSTLFGGTWEQIKDTFLLASGDTYSAGTTGGEAAHVLIESELPKIAGTWATPVVPNHATVGVSGNAYGTGMGTIGKNNAQGITIGIEGTTLSTGTQYGYGFKFGNNKSHNNMPPYLAVYIWKRTA